MQIYLIELRWSSVKSDETESVQGRDLLMPPPPGEILKLTLNKRLRRAQEPPGSELFSA